MAKAPISGLAKTRLAKDSSDEFAAKIANALLQDTIRMVEAFAQKYKCQPILCLTPDSALETISTPQQWQKHPQGHGGLGDRLKNALRIASRQNIANTIIIGTDTPLLDHSHLHQAYLALSNHEFDGAILSVKDGGYALIALGTSMSCLFENIEWSTQKVTGQTLAQAQQNNLSLKCLSTHEQLTDIDYLQDLVSLAPLIEKQNNPELFELLQADEFKSFEKIVKSAHQANI